jgi:hypothetical protein
MKEPDSFENWGSDYPVMKSHAPEERVPKKVPLPHFNSEVTSEPIMAQNVPVVSKTKEVCNYCGKCSTL